MKLDVKVHLTAQIQPETYPPLPAGRSFVRTLHDYETAVWNFKPRSLFSPTDGLKDKLGYPEIVPLRTRAGVKLTQALQRLWFDQLLLAMFEHNRYAELTAEQQDAAKRAWANLTSSARAFTNHAGTDANEGRADFIRGLNLDGELPRIFELSCGGNVFELASSNPESFLGKMWWKVRTLDPAKTYNSSEWNRQTHPEYFHVATNSTPFSRNNRWVVDPFPQLANVGYPGRDVIVPVLSARGFNYVEVSRVVMMKNGDRFPPKPYNP